ncbi:MAG TPA: hemolysin family protein [Lactovum miscens]|uniref:hemolysin family protein n=1 Tax=Lactovum miscens TaxID=190387 RepID=UPI002ED91BBA
MPADPASTNLYLQILLLIVLTIINGFFSASEMALVSVSRSKIEQKASEGDKSYQNLLKLLDKPSNFLSTVQIGVTLIQILVGSSLSDSLTQRMIPLFGSNFKIVAQVIVLAILTFVSIVFGELYPKRIAQNLKEKLALKIVRPIQIIGFILNPFVLLLAGSVNLLSRITPMKFDDAGESMSRDEIEYILDKNEIALDEEERGMLHGVFSLDGMVAREVMVPRTDAFMIDLENDTMENIKAILDESFSRVPLYDDDKDKIIGIIHTKRLLQAGFEKGFDKVNLREIVQEPLFVPETINVDDLLRQLRNTHNQMAILINEYAGVEGLVTLEDLLEEIVGEIEDESDVVSKDFVKIEDDLWIVQGRMTLNDFNEEFDTHLDSEDVDTIAGFYLDLLGSIPSKGEQITVDYDDEENDEHLTITSFEIDDKRLVKLKIHFLPKTQEGDAKDD